MTSTAGRTKKLAILEKITHYLTAFVIILKGADKVSDPEKTGFGIALLLIGSFIVLGTIFHHKAEKALKHFKAYVFALEAVVMSIVGYLYMAEGKQFIQYVCFLASIIFLVALIIYIRKRKNITETHFS